MKALLTVFIIMACMGPVLSQSVGVGTQTPNTSAMLDISSNTKGLLIPRMTENEKAQISSPATGLLIWQTDGTPGFYYNAGTPQGPKWFMLSVADASNWSINGNDDINPAVHFLGTTKAQPLRFRVNNIWAGSIDSATGTFIGFRTGQNDLQGNVAFGKKALAANVNGVGLTAIGNAALQNNQGGSNNTAVGDAALKGNTTGVWNTALGAQSMMNNATGSENVAVGRYTMVDNSGNNNVSVGVYSMIKNSGNDNVAIGYYSQFLNETGAQNVAVGSNTLRSNSTGSSNVAIGFSALHTNDTGNRNVAIGFFALRENKENDNTAVGYYALRNNSSGIQNTAMGNQALFSNTQGSYNTAVGYQTLNKSQAHWNTAMGSGAMRMNWSGDDNSAFGLGALQENTSGGSNTALGVYALRENTTGNNNVAIGRSAGTFNISGNYNTFVGASSNASGTRTNATTIGYTALAECSNCVILGSVNGKNNALVTARVGVGTTNPGFQLQVGESGDGTVARANSWTTFSDERYKTQIVSIDHALDKLDQIGGYYYQWKEGQDQSRQAGLIAQEVERVLPEIVQTDEAGYKSVDYGKMNALLIEAVKEQQKLIKQMQQRIANLEKGKK